LLSAFICQLWAALDEEFKNYGSRLTAAASSRPSPLAAVSLYVATANFINMTTHQFSGLPSQNFRKILAWSKNVF
jgi:hypothetical protein